jgi:hypothetical protein
MNEKNKKQIPLRVSEKLLNAIVEWAEDEFRSVNGQIEYLLTECVKKRKKNFTLETADKGEKDGR